MQIGELSAFSTLDYQNYRDIFNLDLKYLINRINTVVKSFLQFLSRIYMKNLYLVLYNLNFNASSA